MKTLAWQAIIFDFDGVVVESGEIKTQAFANLYRDYGETVMSEVARYHVLHGGMSRYQKFRYFQETLLEKPPLTPEEERHLDQRFSQLVLEAVIASDPVPGAAELIRREAEQNTLVRRLRHTGSGTEYDSKSPRLGVLFYRCARFPHTETAADRGYFVSPRPPSRACVDDRRRFDRLPKRARQQGRICGTCAPRG